MGFSVLTGTLGKVGGVVKAIPLVGDALSGVVDAFTVLPSVLQGTLHTLTQFGALASPAAMRQIEFAVGDAQAVIGQSFIPVMYMMRDAIRLAGDAFATFLPSADEMYRILSPLREAFDEFSDSARETIKEIGPLVKDILTTSFRYLAGNMRLLVQGATAASNAIANLARFLRLLGVPIPEAGDLKTSVGAKAQPARFDSFDEYKKKLQLSAFTEASSAKVSSETIPENVLNIFTVLRDIAGYLLRLTPESIGNGVAKAIAAGAGSLVNNTAAAQAAQAGAAGFAAGGFGVGGIMALMQVINSMGQAPDRGNARARAQP